MTGTTQHKGSTQSGNSERQNEYRVLCFVSHVTYMHLTEHNIAKQIHTQQCNVNENNKKGHAFEASTDTSWPEKRRPAIPLRRNMFHRKAAREGEYRLSYRRKEKDESNE